MLQLPAPGPRTRYGPRGRAHGRWALAVVLLPWLVALAAAPPALAQNGHPGRAVPCAPRAARPGAPETHYDFFTERSSFTYPFAKRTIHAPAYYEQYNTRGLDNVTFEAYAAPPIYIHDGIRAADVEVGTRGGWGKIWMVSPIFRLRQLGGFSSPMSPPSFMPRFISLQLLNISRPGTPCGSWAGGIRIWQVQVLLQHHSNGSSHCLFLQDRELHNHCVAQGPADQLTVDTAGSFSTDFLRISAAWLRGTVDQQGVLRRSLTITGSVELHSSWLAFLPGAIDRELASVYGPYRASVGVEYQRVPFKWAKLVASASAQYIFYEHKPSPDASPVAIDVETALIFDDPHQFFRGWGPMLRFYQGQDYYNVFFFRDIRWFFVGFVIDPMSQHLR